MKAEENIYMWLDKKYGGSKDLDDWTPDDVAEFAEYHHQERLKDIVEKLQPMANLQELIYNIHKLTPYQRKLAQNEWEKILELLGIKFKELI